VIVSLLALPLTIALLQRVPNISDTEIVSDAPGQQPVFVALGHTTNESGVHTAQKAIWQAGPGGLLAHDEIRLLLVTYGTQVSLQHGEIRLAGTDCVYQAAPGAAIVNAGHLAFRRVLPCPANAGGTPEWSLTLAFRGDGRVGLATYFVQPDAVDPNWLALTAPTAGDPRPVAVVRGRYVDTLGSASVRRADLLAYVWHIADSALWIWIAIAVALALIFAGTLWVAPEPATSSLLGRTAGVGLVAFGLALLYVVLVPPLQAPDEPDHMLAFAQVANRPQQADSLAALARRGHFDRIHFRPVERFRPVDVGRPAVVRWGDLEVFAHDVAGRSLITFYWWRLLSVPVAGFTAAETILAVRLANAVVFALALSLAAAVLLWTSGRNTVAPHAVVLALLLIPTLPFFATHVSEFALLTSTYIVLAAVVTALFLDGDRVHWLGLPLGLAASCILAGGRSGLPFVATLVAAIGGRALLGSPNLDGRGDLRRSLIFWSGLAIGLAMFAVLSTPDFRAGLWPGDAGQMPDWFRSAAELFRSRPWYVAAVIPIGLGIEIAAAWIRRRIPEPGRRTFGAVKLACALAVAAVLISLLLSAFVPFPSLNAVEVTPPGSVVAYATEVVRVAVSGIRINHHDWLLSASFWGGFGWLDTVPGDGFVSVLVLLTAVALAALLVEIARSGDARRSLWLAVLGGGWILTLVLYAVASYYLHRNVHGRYLVGLYLSILAVCGSALALWPRSPRPETRGLKLSREVLVVATAAAIHGYALRFILLRYF